MVGISEWLIIAIVLALLFPSLLVGVVAYFAGYKRGAESAASAKRQMEAEPELGESEDEDA